MSLRERRLYENFHDEAEEAKLGDSKNGACTADEWPYSDGVYSW